VEVDMSGMALRMLLVGTLTNVQPVPLTATPPLTATTLLVHSIAHVMSATLATVRLVPTTTSVSPTTVVVM
jgi:hypothetical protein